jgi:hypothetical protein
MPPLIQTETLSIEFFDAGTSATAVTFTPYWDASHPRPAHGFIGRFLLAHGLNVMAFRAFRNHWYQDVTDEHLHLVRQFLDERNLRPRYGLGSSMAGYAAIQFSNALALDRVVAISPQCDVTATWETRWPEVAHVPFRHRISAECVRPECRYTCVYDPHDALDARHIAELRALIPTLDEIRVEKAGHPAGHHLRAQGRFYPTLAHLLGVSYRDAADLD